MARPRSPDHDAQRDRILRCAAQVFAARGYTAATMNEVAAASGVSKATLYHYVRDKHDLLHQIAAGHVARLAALIADPDGAAASGGAEDRLVRLVERFMRAYAGSGAEHRVLTEDTRFLADAERAAVIDGQRELVKAFADRIAEIRPDLAEPAAGPAHTAVAMLLLGMMNWTFTWLRPDGPLDHDRLATMVAQLLRGGLPALSAPKPRSSAR